MNNAHHYRSLLLALGLCLVGPVFAQAYDCSLAASEIDRDRCFAANAEQRRNNDTSRQRIEQYSRGSSGGSESGGYVPTPEEAERLEYWRQRTAAENAERAEKERLYRESDEYKEKMAGIAEHKRQHVWQVRQLRAAFPNPVRFPTPIKASVRDSNRYSELGKDAWVKEQVNALFPDLGKAILKRSISGYWNFKKYGSCIDAGGTEGEILGLLPVAGERLAAIFSYQCLGEQFYEFQSLSPSTENSTSLDLEPRSYAAALTAAGVPEARQFAPERELSGMELREKRCNDGQIDECVQLAHDFRTGNGVKQNLSRTRELLQKTCDATPARGCGEVARYHYEGGFESAPSTQQAYAAAQRGCSIEHSQQACGVLGTLYLQGYAVDRSYTEALRYLRPACAAGDGYACLQLGQMYDRGQGVVRAPGEARKAYGSACQSGLDSACTRLKALEG